MKLINRQIVTAELHKMNLALSSRKTPEEINALGAIFLEDCEFMAIAGFKTAMAQYRRGNKYFPAPKDIIEQYGCVLESGVKANKLLPIPILTDEQIKYNIKRLEGIKRRLKIKSVPKAKVSKHGEVFVNLNTPHAVKVKAQAKKILGER